MKNKYYQKPDLMIIVTETFELQKRQRDFLRKVGLLVCMVLFSIASYSQKYQAVQQSLIPENLDQMYKKPTQKASVSNLFKEIDGTYQIQCLVPDYKILLSEALYNKILASRKADVAVYVELDNNSRLFLPSANEIKRKDFNKLSNSIYITK